MITGSSGFRVCDGGAVGASWLVVKKITEDASRPVREFSRFDGDALLGLDSLGLRGVAQRHLPEGGRGGVWEVRYEPVEPARVCRDCGVPAPVRSSRWRRFVHVLLGKAGVRLLVRCRRYECRGCGGAGEDDLSRVAADGRRLTERAAWWAVASVVLDAMSVRSVAATLGCLWDCANDAVPAKGMKHLAGDEHRLDGVTHLGVDEHVWRHTSRGSRYVTVVVDLTPRRDGRPARLLDVVEGRSGAAFAGWLASRSEEFRRNVRVVAMDAFAGYKHAVRKAVPHAREVLDPFHVVRLAGDKLRLAAYYRDAFRGGGVCGLGCGACWPAWAVGSSPPRAARCGCGCSCSARPSPWPRTWWPCGGSPRTGRGRSSVSCSSPWRARSCSGAAGVACMRCAPPATRTGSPTRIGRGSPSVRPRTGRVAAEPAAQSFEPADLLLEFADAFPSVLDGQGDVVLVPGAAQERHVGAVGQFAPFVLASRPLVVAQRGRVVRVPAEPLGLLGFGALVDGLADRGGAQRVRLYFVKSVFRV